MITGLVSKTTVARRGRLYASSAGMCSRQSSLYNLVAEDMTIVNGAPSAFYFGIGNTVHELVAQAMRKHGALVAAEYRVPEMGIELGGKIDLIVRLDGALNIIEIKTCGALPKAPKPEHEAQALLYNVVTGLPVHVLYVSRNVADYRGNMNIASFQLDTSEAKTRPIMLQVALGYLYSKERLVAPLPSRFTNEEDCGFCPFKEMCWHKEPFPADHPDAERAARLLQRAVEMTDAVFQTQGARNAEILKRFEQR